MFTGREGSAQMAAIGTAYTEWTVFKTMQRMKEIPNRSASVQLEQTKEAGFRIVDGDDRR